MPAKPATSRLLTGAVCYHHRPATPRYIRLVRNAAARTGTEPGGVGPRKPLTRSVDTTPQKPPVLRLGDYAIGDEDCPFLYGPTDLRY
ncbi:hypothetical protein [Hymenobacter sublimis]|uniref:Uncharacterized protein n=1 Tax=Hymenobacter sublimis TaxID=2933777 RepID=A0ABY4J8U1_9BACT|nr:hypothetical protein [Hymenobacter sublimis]UPL49221.1 hypothetical protein MWH26_18840 [Hymenobacter sublimis]